jgi:hypothetical protein
MQTSRPDTRPTSSQPDIFQPELRLQRECRIHHAAVHPVVHTDPHRLPFAAASNADAHAQLALLRDVSIQGNMHMTMQYRDNLDITDWILGWIDTHIDAMIS